ncbi:prolyl oligopeptidase family serine peptidase [Streptomyces albipurpureus]|uniref:Prolyl oligopeptidase family serine peptidase n=1 Tax=Streptomyces albipurpureus TaxID=2897419 RepID=A0ABT0UKE0_9ACTN|nr:prolyl oligopeptidase family serine peptidase [Streptomyces sp. CWNU-1]MCM2389098.1 prolyl oligopeptidase family serine peptidase [Streptomyces sp. CWNU-1]
MTMRTQLSFPRQYARTQRYTLGAPRSFTISPDGSRVIFIRSPSGTDRRGQLWVMDLEAGTGQTRERLAADPEVLLGGTDEQLSTEERARRERSREGGTGIVAYAVDGAAELAAFALSGRLFTAELRAGTTRELPAHGPVVDPRPSPDGRRIAYASGGALRVVEAEGEGDRALAEPEGEDVSYGTAEFIAAEEMGRLRGFWWSPDSDRLLVARVDQREVRRWWIPDPAHPDRAPERLAYPTAGTSNAEVRLFLVSLEGERREIGWDRTQFPYLARVHWSKAGAPILLVQSRDQRIQRYLAVDTESGDTRTVHIDEDSAWLDLCDGVPVWGPGGALVRIVDVGGARVLAVGDQMWTGPSLQPRAVLDVGENDVLLLAAAGEEAAHPEIGEIHVYRVTEQGIERVSEGRGVHTAVRSGALTVLASARLEAPGTSYRLLRDGEALASIASHAERPVLTARPRLSEVGVRRIPCAVLLPQEYQESDGPLPVLLDPYAGPRGQRVYAAQNSHLTSQWFADQGFAVIVADGRGSRGRSPAWEKSIKDNFPLTLDDQIDALHNLAERYPLDLGRVGIRGWSYGGYLAALAVLRRPDVFHAGIAGAPVTDFRLYDTHYTERYLGDPAAQPAVYTANSLVTEDGLSAPENPARPLMIIHGLADDNVVAANSLRLSSALLAAGREHEVLPLSGVTHMTPQEQIAENLLLLQVGFLKRALG